MQCFVMTAEAPPCETAPLTETVQKVFELESSFFPAWKPELGFNKIRTPEKKKVSPVT